MFKKYKKDLEKLGYKVYANKVAGPKGDIVATVNPYGNVESKDQSFLSLLKEKPKKKKSRARDEEGKFLGDDPLTPEINEAWTSDDY
jgi:hypothetical protein